MRVTAPHIRAHRTSADIMTHVCIALMPTVVAAVWFFKWDALLRLAVALAASLAAGTLTGNTHGVDTAAVVTGLLLCLSCPSQIPLWLLTGGCFLAICVMRDGFGGIGKNLFNPAMAARAVMLTVFPSLMTGFGLPHALSSATPLQVGAPLWDLTVGRVGGSMGETSALMIVLGLAWLLFRRVVRWQVPLFAFVGFAAVTLLAGRSLLTECLSGSFLFGTVFIVTDYTGKPATKTGEILFALTAGTLMAVFRFFGPYPEGVCFAVLTANLLAPFFEKETLR